MEVKMMFRRKQRTTPEQKHTEVFNIFQTLYFIQNTTRRSLRTQECLIHSKLILHQVATQSKMSIQVLYFKNIPHIGVEFW
jgi:hypothetical protein